MGGIAAGHGQVQPPTLVHQAVPSVVYEQNVVSLARNIGKDLANLLWTIGIDDGDAVFAAECRTYRRGQQFFKILDIVGSSGYIADFGVDVSTYPDRAARQLARFGFGVTGTCSPIKQCEVLLRFRGFDTLASTVNSVRS
jgi:hypothetical protein